MTTEEDILRLHIDQKQKEIDRLRFTYGDSVRPAWVGEEVGILLMYKQDAEEQLKQLEEKNAADRPGN